MPGLIIPYTMLWPQGHTIVILCPPGHTIYHAMLARLYHIPCHASSGHKIDYAMPARPYLSHDLPARPCHAHQAIPHKMPCPPGHTIYHAMQAGHTKICHASPGHNIIHAMPTRPYHNPYHGCQFIPYTMLGHGQRLLR